ncbi:coiled-coil domain-containing protein 43-like [Ornithodoros turicata]
MAAFCGDFELWLSDKLRALNIDPDVFGSYITGILEGNETEEEKSEALQGILTEVCEEGIGEIGEEIFSKWSALNKDVEANGDQKHEKCSVEAQLVSIMEEQAKSVVSEKVLSPEEVKLRQAILAQYAEVSDGEEDEFAPDIKPAVAVAATSVTGVSIPKDKHASKSLERNTNAETVLQAEKEKRDKNKQDHERKKAQDKVNREKQKQQQQERKDREKKRTQKGERRR